MQLCIAFARVTGTLYNPHRLAESNTIRADGSDVTFSLAMVVEPTSLAAHDLDVG